MNTNFKLDIKKKENFNEYNKIKKEKCGEILITNHGIFEIICLLCEQDFKNIRNYAKHILELHFQCDVDTTIDSLLEVEANIQCTKQEIKLENQQILEDKIIFKGKHKSIESNAVTDFQITEKSENDSIKLIKNVKETENNFGQSMDTNNMKNNYDSDSDINEKHLNELKQCYKLQTNTTDEDQTFHESDYSENSQNQNNKNTYENKFEIKNDNEIANLKSLKSKSKKLDTKLICKICGKQTARYKMQQHLRSHDNSRYVHQCNQCLKLFISEKSLNFHIKNLHTEEKPFVCELNNCGKRYVNENALNAHIKRHGERPFTCDICGKGFLYQSRLNEHVSQHIIKLRKETGLETHLESEKKSGIIVNCLKNSISSIEDCQPLYERNFDPTKRKKFKQKQVIKSKKKLRKVTVFSKPLEKIICDICGKETPKTNIKQHLRSHDNSRYTYKCDLCTKLFISEKSLDLHIKNLHIKDKPFVCTIENCEKRFVNENALKSHIIRHTSPREFKCETCNKAFIYHYRLEEHIKTYHVNGRMYGCDLCEKKFFDKHTLERHQIVHSEEKPYKCDECSAKFSRERSLEWHKKSHTGVKDYTCKICGKQYALYNGIYSHMKVHGIKYSIAYEKGLTDGKSDLNTTETEISS